MIGRLIRAFDRRDDGALAGAGEDAARELDRRAWLRTGGAVLAGLAVAQTAGATNADAAAGDAVLLGAANTADATATSLTSAATTAATLTIANTGSSRAPLALAQQPFPASIAGLTSGDLANFDGDLYYTAGDPAGPLTGFVYTEFTATQIVPIKPRRILDTRTTAGRAHIVTTVGNLDSLHRLRAGHTIVIRLSSLEVAAEAAYGNLSVVTPLAAGSMVVWAGGTRPGTRSIYYKAGGTTSNFAVTGTSATDTVAIYSSATTHVVLDITAFAVGTPDQINPTVLALAATSTARLAAHTQAGTLPDWYPTR